MVTKYVEMKKRNIHVLCIWPSAIIYNDKLKDVDKQIREKTSVVYDKFISISYEGLRNLMIQVNAKFDWLGSVENNYKGIEGKVDPCYNKCKKMRLYVIEEKQETILSLKNAIREIFGIGNHSAHSSDNKEEAEELVHLLLNDNTLHLLNNGKIGYDIETVKRLKEFKKQLLDKEESLENYIIASSAVMDFYGIRKTGDLDYLALVDKQDFSEDKNNHFINHYETSLSDLILNPENYA